MFAIDPEIRDYMDPASGFADTELERQILRDGRPKQSLEVWKEKNILIDGHRRYGVCAKHELPYDVKYISLPDREAAFEYMEEVALPRRNLTPAQEAKFIARKLEREKKKGLPGAAKRVAEATGTSVREVYRKVEYAEALESLPKDIQNRIKSGDIKASARDVLELATLSEHHVRAVIHNVETGHHKSLGKALFGDDDKQPGSNRDKLSQSKPEPVKENAADIGEEDDADIDEEEQGEVGEDGEVEEEEEEEEAPSRPRSQSDSAPVTADEDGFNDHVRPAVTPVATARPSAKPAADLVKEAQKRLGLAQRALDALNSAAPHAARYGECKRLLDAYNRALAEWQREAE